jgi:hypothetical protein
MTERSQVDMSTEPKTITVEVEKETVEGNDRWWEIKVVAKDEEGKPPDQMRIYGEWQKLVPKPCFTNGAGEASLKLYLAPQEPPESQAHPNLLLKVEEVGGGVTFGVRVHNHDRQPIPGVEIAFSSALGTFEQQGLVITGDDGKVSCRLVGS